MYLQVFCHITDLPIFIKTPKDAKIQPGSTLELECSARGPPNLVVSWQKDGISNFLAVVQKRWHVDMKTSLAYINNVKQEDGGIYSCVATNEDGIVTANASITIEGGDNTCINHKGDTINSGQEFTPDSENLCKICLCDHGYPVVCRLLPCSHPAECQQVGTECCQCQDHYFRQVNTSVVDDKLDDKVSENDTLICYNHKNEIIPSGQEFIKIGRKLCQVCLCDRGTINNCKICDTSHCAVKPSGPCCAKCLTSSTQSGVQNDAIPKFTNEYNKQTFDHSNNQIEPVTNHSVLSESRHYPTIALKSSNQSKDSIVAKERISSNHSKDSVVAKEMVSSNQSKDSVVVNDHDTYGNNHSAVVMELITNHSILVTEVIANHSIVVTEVVTNHSTVVKEEVSNNQSIEELENDSKFVDKKVEILNQNSLQENNAVNQSFVEDLFSNKTTKIVDYGSFLNPLKRSDSEAIMTISTPRETATGTSTVPETSTPTSTIGEPITVIPNITCTDWKGNLHYYGEEYAPYKEDSCKLCLCGEQQYSKLCRTVRKIECPNRNCTYYVWKIGMDCCEYECIESKESIQKPRKLRHRKLEIMKPPRNATILAEYSHTLHCRANKRKPRPLYKWFKNGVRIKDRVYRDEDTGSFKYDINKKTGALKLIHVHVEDKGVYHCKVKHGNETVISPKVYIEVQVPVKFVGLIPFNRAIMCGTPAQLVCNVYGIPLPQMVWTKNGNQIGNQPPEGINVYTSIQGNEVLSRLYISNVTETNRYGCKAYNRPVGGMNVVQQDVQITMMCTTGTKNKPVGQCVPYNGTFCRSEIESSNVHKIVNVTYDQLDHSVESMIDDIKRAMNPMDDKCLTSAKKIFCNHVFPGCHYEEGEAKPIPMCRQTCLAVKELLCFDPWLLVAHSSSGYRLPDCNSLPNKLDPTVKCVDIPMFVRNPQETSNSCYKGTGQWYNGTVNTTKSGLPCQSWESQTPHSHSRPPDVFPSLEGADNFCRNPGSEEKSPWCYTQDRLVRWEECDVPKCDGEPLLPRESREDKQQFSTVAILIVSIVSTVGAFVIGLIVILCYQIFRQKRNIKYNSAPQDELDIDIDKLQPNISYHKMADVKLNPKLQALEYNRNNVVYLCDIGQGAFGRVFKAKATEIIDDVEESFVAVKMLKEDAGEDLQQDFEREASLMAEFDHPNIVKLLGICAIGKPMCLLFEFMESGDLNGFLRLCSSESNYIIRHNCKDKKMSEQFQHVGTSQQMYILMQICSGMVYLSERGYVHRDLATRNCLVGENLTVKISDFGLARSIHSMEYYKGSDHDAIPIRWMPLESILYNKFTPESDVWSFGVVLWEVFSYALQPYYGMSHEEVVQFIKDGKVLACPDKTPKAIYDLMRLCWSRKPASRPRFITISKTLHTINEEILKKPNSLTEAV